MARTWHPITPVTLGDINLGSTSVQTFALSKANIPTNATEVLVHAYIRTGTCLTGAKFTLKVYVKLSSTSAPAFYLYGHGYKQNAWSYNSDDVWLPMPPSSAANVYAQVQGSAPSGNYYAGLSITAYSTEN